MQNNTGGEEKTMAEMYLVAEKLDDIKERLVIIETKMEAYKGMDRMAHDAVTSSTAAHKRMDKMEDTLTWLWRVLGAAIIVEVARAVMHMGPVS